MPLISKVEEVKLLEPNMPLQRPKSSLANSSNPETPISKHRQSEALLAPQEWSLAVPCSRNFFGEARVEGTEENTKVESTDSWLRSEVLRPKTQRTSSAVQRSVMNFCTAQF